MKLVQMAAKDFPVFMASAIRDAGMIKRFCRSVDWNGMIPARSQVDALACAIQMGDMQAVSRVAGNDEWIHRFYEWAKREFAAQLAGLS